MSGPDFTCRRHGTAKRVHFRSLPDSLATSAWVLLIIAIVALVIALARAVSPAGRRAQPTNR
jgi:hypothetical protein